MITPPHRKRYKQNLLGKNLQASTWGLSSFLLPAGCNVNVRARVLTAILPDDINKKIEIRVTDGRVETQKETSFLAIMKSPD